MKTLTVCVVAFDGADDLDVIGPLEVLRRAEALGAPFRVLLTVPGPDLWFTTIHGVQMRADAVASLPTDVLVVAGGGWHSGGDRGVRAQLREGTVPRLIAEAHTKGTLVATVCTGALLFAASGAAHGRRMATHQSAIEDLRNYGAIVVEERVVDDGDVISCGGVTSGIDLALHLVSRLHDDHVADAIARVLEYDALRRPSSR